jgi:P-type Ca2+ transporter type 2C
LKVCMSTNWHEQTVEQVLLALHVDSTTGLDETEVAARLQKHGRNQLTESGAKNPWHILWEQFTATMVLILIAAGALSVLLGKANESIAIFVIVLLFGLMGFIQEYRAERAMAALKRMSVPRVRVRRSGVVREIAASEVCLGDLVLLEAGGVVPADVRLIESNNLRIQESALTGESEPVPKEINTQDREDMPLGDRSNMGYLGTLVTYGRGLGVVTAVGMNTELGKIASLMQSVQSEATPLQQRLNQLGKWLAIAGLMVAAVVFIIGWLSGETPSLMMLTAVSVAVAIIPEGLPAVVTFSLSLGARRMLRRNALVRKLATVETLGSVTTICSDKTGTLTENRMTVVVLDVAGHRVNVEETLRRDAPSMETSQQGALLRDLDTAEQMRSLNLLLVGGALCNDAQTTRKDGRIQTIGDPTEGALLVAAELGGVQRLELEELWPRVAEVPFDSDRKRMTTIHRRNPAKSELQHPMADGLSPALSSDCVAFTKGAVDSLLGLSTQLWSNDSAVPMTPEFQRRIESINVELAAKGMRVLGVAFKLLRSADESTAPASALERDLTFVGFFGLIDPPRTEARTAVASCRTAGIRPVMITGDHPLTARYVAQDLGIIDAKTPANDSAITGTELEPMSDGQLNDLVRRVSVYARVSPEHKLRIVRALQAGGEIVAMTGDGVNDAPALKQADIGVAMGVAGTEVTKEAADMVLLDDNFATIVAAVEEGRTIYGNVRRFVRFSVAGNIGKVGVMLAAPLAGMPTALLPLQLLWLNLLTDGLLGLGTGFEPPEKTTMQRPPVAPRSGLFSDGGLIHATWVGVLIASLSLGAGALYWQQSNSAWQTMIFNTLAFAQLGQAIASRSNRESLFSLGLFSNRPLLWMAFLVAITQLAVINLPSMETFFQTTRLNANDWIINIGSGMVVGAAEKLLARRRERSRQSRPAALSSL